MQPPFQSDMSHQVILIIHMWSDPTIELEHSSFKMKSGASYTHVITSLLITLHTSGRSGSKFSVSCQHFIGQSCLPDGGLLLLRRSPTHLGRALTEVAQFVMTVGGFIALAVNSSEQSWYRLRLPVAALHPTEVCDSGVSSAHGLMRSSIFKHLAAPAFWLLTFPGFEVLWSSVSSAFLRLRFLSTGAASWLLTFPGFSFEVLWQSVSSGLLFLFFVECAGVEGAGHGESPGQSSAGQGLPKEQVDIGGAVCCK
jgi:hypothetical protein